MTRRTLLTLGIGSSLIYVVADLAGTLVVPGFSMASHAVSELMAPGAPSRPLVLSLMSVRTLLLLAFAWGVWQSAGPRTALRIAAVLLVAEALIGQATATVFPAPVRGSGLDPMPHLVGTLAESLCILFAMGFAAAAIGGRFRVYSIVTIVLLLGFGVWTGFDAPAIESGLPTPGLGLKERANIYAYLLWIAVLALVLLRNAGVAGAPSTAAARRGAEAR